jgi:hypothetical protein
MVTILLCADAVLGVLSSLLCLLSEFTRVRRSIAHRQPDCSRERLPVPDEDAAT